MISFASRFIRTIILSRLLAPTDYGAVVVLTTVYAIFEMATDVGLDRFVVVSGGSDRAQAVAAAQQIALLRGALLALVILAAAPILALTFGAGVTAEAIRWLSPLPLIRSLANLRIKQVQHEYRNGPDAVTVGTAQISAVLAVLPAIFWFHDERAMLVSLYVEAILYVVVSRLVLPRESVAHVDPALRRRALVYGLPLVANGVGLVVYSQLDRLVVGNLFGLETLALYSLVMNLAIVPISALLIVASNLGVAFLVRRIDDKALSQPAALLVTWTMLVVAAIYATSMALFLEILVPLVYGNRYTPTPAMLAAAPILAFLRISRAGPTIMMLAYGLTRRLTAANLIAGVGLAGGYALGLHFHRLDVVLACIVLGDILSCGLIFYLVRRHLPISRLIRHASLLALPVASAVYLWGINGNPGFMERSLVIACGVIVVGLELYWGRKRYLAHFFA